jgi:hypothetical protein
VQIETKATSGPLLPSRELIERETALHAVLLQIVFESMKKWSWFFVIAAAATALALSSCVNQEGVGANPAELPDRPQKAD